MELEFVSIGIEDWLNDEEFEESDYEEGSFC